jgi:hypothetical protein
VNAEFNWWLLIVGVVVGALLTWLVLADSTRREQDVTAQEVPAEAGWLARTLADQGIDVDPSVTEAMLRAHRRYLGLPPPDAFVDPETLERVDLEPEGPDEPASTLADPTPVDELRIAGQVPTGRPERGAAG